jgi:dTDP-4-dehydrorhamnose reductase
LLMSGDSSVPTSTRIASPEFDMWLLIGGDSEIGAATYETLKAQGRPVSATTRRPDRVDTDRPFLDLAAPLEDWEPPPQTRAACIFAAIARLVTCAADPVGSAHINVTQTVALIERLIEQGIPVLFLSTNQVFDGNTPNVPADAPVSPISAYGRQKARAEAALRPHMDSGRPVAILRLAKVVSPQMSLVQDWIRALMAGQPIRAFHDMNMAPVPIELVIAAITSLLQHNACGIFQLTGPRDVTYAEVARFIAAYLGVDSALVEEISALDAGLPEGATPRQTTLDSSLLGEHGFQVPDVWRVIETVMAAKRAQPTSHPLILPL